MFNNCKTYNPMPTDPVRLASLKLSEVFENSWVSSGLCAEVQRAKRATAGIAAPKFEPEEYDGAGAPRKTTSHRSADQQQPRMPVRGGGEAGCARSLVLGRLCVRHGLGCCGTSPGRSVPHACPVCCLHAGLAGSLASVPCTRASRRLLKAC